MYEDLHKPRLLKDVPLAVLRSLPVLYYTNKYAGELIPPLIYDRYQAHLDYLCLTLHTIAELINQPQFTKLSDEYQLAGYPPAASKASSVQQMSMALARLCSDSKAELKPHYQTLRMRCSKIFKEKVSPLRILVVDNKGDEEALRKVLNILRTFCYYRAEYLPASEQDTSIIYSNIDFIVIFSTASPHIHDQVRILRTIDKPGIALVRIYEEITADMTSIRIGRQLIKSGFPVLFNIFTPIRLFTTIDKTYIKHYLI